ncbi:putative serine/threonine protein kinase [Trypanosoma vivax]|nr:putative serine/threonine protein kinase [Trypanosoma vivax]
MSVNRWEASCALRSPITTSQTIGNYRVGETVGKGTFGKVKKGWHIPTGEVVAIKILSPQKLENAKMKKKLFREIKILRLFSHPNICRLYDVILSPTEIYLIMEYVEGGELYDYIVKNGALPEDDARYVLQQIVCAVEYCHHFLVIHRDLKPENILIGPGLQVKLIDFGLSNIMSDGEFLATSCGSPNYAAPEVISGKLYAGPEVDVWSCGVILYALLCSRLPFDEETIPQLFAKIRNGEYCIPHDVPAGPRELIKQILVVDPLQRLTIPQIRDNAWFNCNLPLRLSYNESMFRAQDIRVSPKVVTRAARSLNIREKEVRNSLKEGHGPGLVAYNILFDAEQRHLIAAEAEARAKLKNNVSSPSSGCDRESYLYTSQVVSTHAVNATERELNRGLLLTQSPAMESLLDTGCAATNKCIYNGGNFVPASVQETKTLCTPLSTPITGGMFCIGRNQETSSTPNYNPSNLSYVGSSSGQPFCSAIAEGTRKGSGSGLPASVNDRQRVGSVAKSHMVYTREEEEFIVKNNVGWRIGLMTSLNANVSMSIIYSTLRSFEMEWKVIAPFRLHVRTTAVSWERLSSVSARGAAENKYESNQQALTTSPSRANKVPRVVLAIHLFRIHEKRERGYLVDFSIVHGSLLGLDVLLRLSTALLQRMG